MEKIIKVLLTFLSFNSLVFAQTIYSAKYKSFTVEQKNNAEKKSQLKDFFLSNLIYSFYSNEKVCYLKDTKTFEMDGVNSKIIGDENIYVNYDDNSVRFTLNSDKLSTYKNLVFKKNESTLKVLGMETTKYVSLDGNIILYTTKKLPWYLQPCLFSANQLKESVVRFENNKSGTGLELIEFTEINATNDFKEISTKILSKKSNNKKQVIICPFLL